MYVCFVLNNAFSEVIQSTPLCQAYRTDNDISPMLYFSFYELVYYLVDETTFPSKSKELRRRWVGVSENVGHFMTYKILIDDTRPQIIHRSNIRSAADPNARNLRLDPLNDAPPEVIRSLCKASPALDHGEDFSLHSMEPTDENPERPSTGDDTVIVDPQELLGCTFLMDTQEDGQRFRAHIVECISDHKSIVRHSDDHVKFRISVNEDEYEEIITYNESVVNSSTQPHSKLHKRHNALSFHCIHEAIASGYVMLTHLPGKFNPVDILSKHWGYQTIWPILKPILFFHGDTADLIQDYDTV
jgi:hypothetical protein